MLDCAECPAGEARRRSISVALTSQDALDTVRTDKLDFYITATTVLNPDLDRYMFQLLKVVFAHQVFSNRHLARDATLDYILSPAHSVEDVHGTIAHLNRWHFNPSLRLDGLPALRGFDEFDTTEGTIPVLVTVRTSGSGVLPVGVFRIDLDSGAHAKVLHVSPVEIRTGCTLSIIQVGRRMQLTEHLRQVRKFRQHLAQQQMYRHECVRTCSFQHLWSSKDTVSTERRL